MAKITQYSRISHHTISGTPSAGLTFSVPAQEDFTDGSWTPFDLALSEIGVNEEDKKVYIRIDDEILELGTIGGSSSLGITPSWGQVLSVGNTSDGNNIIMDLGGQILSGVGEVLTGLSDTGILLDKTDGLSNQTIDIGTPLLAGSFVEIRNIDSNGNYSKATFATSSLNIKVEDANLGFENKIFMEPSLGGIEIVNQDFSNFFSKIIISTQSTLIDTQDLLTPKQGKLEVDRNFILFGHFDSSVGDLSVIQSQDDTITLTTQNSAGDSSIQTITPGYVDITTTTQSSGDFTQFRIDSSSIKHNGNGRGIAEPVVYDLSPFLSTINATPQDLASIDVSGFSGSVITIAGIVTAFGSTNSKAYGANLFATFKYFGGTLTQVSTTDKSEKTDFSTATSDINTSGTDIRIRVTGEASTDMYWWSRYNYEIVHL